MRKWWRRLLCAIEIHGPRRIFGDDVAVCTWCRLRLRVLPTTHVELDICDTQRVHDIVIEPSCMLPPEGWFCSLIGGHSGPCPTYEVDPR